jgi:GR25 family glycosyltransferase involved in LPS biosynthesis
MLPFHSKESQHGRHIFNSPWYTRLSASLYRMLKYCVAKCRTSRVWCVVTLVLFVATAVHLCSFSTSFVNVQQLEPSLNSWHTKTTHSTVNEPVRNRDDSIPDENRVHHRVAFWSMSSDADRLWWLGLPLSTPSEILHKQLVQPLKPNEQVQPVNKDRHQAGSSMIHRIVDMVYVINLDRMPERWTRTKLRLMRAGIRAKRISAVDGKSKETRALFSKYTRSKETLAELQYPQMIVKSAAEMAHSLSVLNVIHDARSKGYRRILVCSDTIVLHNKFNEQLTVAMADIPSSWRLLQFDMPPIRANVESASEAGVYHPSNSLDGSFAVALDSSVFDLIELELRHMRGSIRSSALHAVYRRYFRDSFALQPSLITTQTTVGAVTEHFNVQVPTSQQLRKVECVSIIVVLSKHSNNDMAPVEYGAFDAVPEMSSFLAPSKTYHGCVELIIVDDSVLSSSSVAQWLETANDHTNVKFISHRQPQGWITSMNAALTASTSQHLVFAGPALSPCVLHFLLQNPQKLKAIVDPVSSGHTWIGVDIPLGPEFRTQIGLNLFTVHRDVFVAIGAFVEPPPSSLDHVLIDAPVASLYQWLARMLWYYKGVVLGQYSSIIHTMAFASNVDAIRISAANQRLYASANSASVCPAVGSIGSTSGATISAHRLHQQLSVLSPQWLFAGFSFEPSSTISTHAHDDNRSAHSQFQPTYSYSVHESRPLLQPSPLSFSFNSEKQIPLQAYFARTYVISHHDRTNQWKASKLQLLQAGLFPERRFPSGSSVSVWWVDCLLGTIRHARQMGYDRILVFADEFALTNGFSSTFTSMLTSLSREWKLLSLSPVQLEWPNGTPEPGSFYHPYADSTRGFTALALHFSVFELFMLYLEQSRDHSSYDIDRTVLPALYLRHHTDCYATYPPLVADADIGAAPIESAIALQEWRTVPSTLNFADELVTLIVTAHNAQDTIGFALRSLQRQTYRKIEIIVVDDASDDDTVKIAQSYAEHDPRIRVFENKSNIGAYSSRNIAVHHSKGQVIMIHDADDYAAPDRVAKQLLPIMHGKVLYTLCDHIRPALDLSAFELADDLFAEQALELRNRYDSIGHLSYHDRTKPGLMTTAVHRSLLEQIGMFTPLQHSGDAEFFERVLYVYRGIYVYPGSTWFDTLTKQLRLPGPAETRDVLAVLQGETIVIASKFGGNLSSKFSIGGDDRQLTQETWRRLFVAETCETHTCFMFKEAPSLGDLLPVKQRQAHK